MLKTLFRKQWMEMTAGLVRDKKTGKPRSTTAMVLFVLLYVFAFLVIAAMFTFLSLLLCPTLSAFGLGWLYFAIMGLMAVLFGLFGSVFQTYSSLYCAKDNDMLLSFPIRPKDILITRLFGIWIWAFAFEGLVLLPAMVLYWMFVSHSILTILCSLLVFFALSFLILTLSCLLGYVIAKVGAVLKGKKSLVLSLLGFVLFVGYYYVCMRAYEIIETFLANAALWGESVKGKAYVLYLFGSSFEGGVLATLGVIGIIAIAFFLMWYVMSRSFIRLATVGNAHSTKRRKATIAHRKHPIVALMGKELRRFVSSTTYMLNCGMGTLLLPIAGIAILIKGNDLRAMMAPLLAQIPMFSNLLAPGACAAICMITSMNDITAPSVSLEGKHLWILQSMPVSTFQILLSKIGLHLLLTWIPTLICSICVIIALRLSFVMSIFVLVLPLLFVLLNATFGLVLNLKMPNLNWTNETTPVKQSMAVMLSLFGGWGIILLLGVAYFLLFVLFTTLLPAWLYLTFCTLLFAAGTAGLFAWLYHRGTKIFESL